VDSSPVYEKIAQNVTDKLYTDASRVYDTAETVTYKITRAGAASSAAGACVTLNHSTELERMRYRYWVRQVNMPCGGAEVQEYLGE